MSVGKSEYDVITVAGVIAVFALPITLLVPDFSIWDVIPKIQITRLHAFSYQVSWSELNGTMVSAITLLFCLYLELRKRRLDEITANVFVVNDNVEVTMAEERDRQAAALRVCVELLDSTAEHYENLVLLRDELRRRDKPAKCRPPTIDSSSID